MVFSYRISKIKAESILEKATMSKAGYAAIKKALGQLYVNDDKPWLVGFSGGKDSTVLATR